MLLSRLSAPAKAPPNGPPVYCGVRRAKSLMRSLIVGSVASALRPTVVAAPVRAELKTSDDCAVTVTSSLTVTLLSCSTRSVAVPRLTITSCCGLGWKPPRFAVTV